MYIMTDLRRRYFTPNNKGKSSILSIYIQFTASMYVQSNFAHNDNSWC